MKKQVKKLVLSKETVLNLKKEEVQPVVGGIPSQQILLKPGFCTEGVSCLC